MISATIDASVFIASLRSSEPAYAESWACLQAIRKNTVEIICPTLVLPECAAAIIRPTQDQQLASDAIYQISNFPLMHLISLTQPLANRASEIAIECRLRGADAIYVAVAEFYSTQLISLDQEMLERGKQIVTTVTPKIFCDMLATTKQNSPHPQSKIHPI
jgi:predicted nucleic acid-binding protein